MGEGTSVLRLSELAQLIAAVFRQTLGGERFWVVAEVVGLKVNRGHCYLQLAEKDEVTTTPKAEFRGIIWSSLFEKLHTRFIRETGSPLREQVQILCCVEVQYHERYGLSLVVQDLDPSYTLGQLEMERRKTLERLQQEGLFDRNRSLYLQPVPQRLAVISAADSRGYEDFITTLQQNNSGYRFFVKLYPSLMQGDLAANDIIAKLRQIKKEQSALHFDAILLVRGGGSSSSLECFNRYELAAEVAQANLPVICGVGHTADRSVTDQVSHTAVITPTDAAVFLLQRLTSFEGEIDELRKAIAAYANDLVKTESLGMQELSFRIRSQVKQQLTTERYALQQAAGVMKQAIAQQIHQEAIYFQKCSGELRLHTLRETQSERNFVEQAIKRLQQGSRFALQAHQRDLDFKESTVMTLDPASVLKRGYSMTIKENKLITSSNQLETGETIKTIFASGEVTSIIESKNG